MATRPDLAAVIPALLDLDSFARRMLQDCLQQASRDYWLRRARQFDAVPGDTSDEELRARCELTAKLCRHRASLCLDVDPVDEDLVTWVLGEVA